MEHYIKDNKCDITTLSLSTSTVLAAVEALTVPINLLIIISIIRERKTQSNNRFYKLLLNCAIADLFTGGIVDSVCLHVNLKITLHQQKSFDERLVLTLALFYLDSVALMTMILLCIDRSIALLYFTQSDIFRVSLTRLRLC